MAMRIFVRATSSAPWACAALLACRWEAPPKGAGWHGLDAGSLDACAIAADGTVECWGNGLSPTPEGTFLQVAVGRTFTCGLREDGQVECWGPEQWRVDAPTGTFLSITAGHDFGCGIDVSNAVRCWGHEPSDPPDSGDGVPSFRERAHLLPPDGVFVAISAGDDQVCAVREDRSVVCWGQYEIDVSESPGPFDDVTVGEGFACATHSDGAVACWYSPSHDSAADWGVPEADRVIDMDCGRDGCCVVDTDGAARCTYGGDGTWLDEPGPYDSVAAGIGIACALDVAGVLACWASPPEPRR